MLGWKHIPAVKGLTKLKRGRGEWKRLSVANKWDVALYQRAKEALHQKRFAFTAEEKKDDSKARLAIHCFHLPELANLPKSNQIVSGSVCEQ